MMAVLCLAAHAPYNDIGNEYKIDCDWMKVGAGIMGEPAINDMQTELIQWGRP